MKGYIKTTELGFKVVRKWGKHERTLADVIWEKAEHKHIDVVKYLAKKHFKTGTLKRTTSAELYTHGFIRWGFKERTGEISVVVDHYYVF
jgi:hypothetical protein